MEKILNESLSVEITIFMKVLCISAAVLRQSQAQRGVFGIHCCRLTSRFLRVMIASRFSPSQWCLAGDPALYCQISNNSRMVTMSVSNELQVDYELIRYSHSAE